LAVRNNSYDGIFIYYYGFFLGEPGLIARVERCIVYYDKYIDCRVRAPIMVPAIINGLEYKFRFEEVRLP